MQISVKNQGHGGTAPCALLHIHHYNQWQCSECLYCCNQRKTEDAESVEEGAEEAKKAKPSEETNGEGDSETNGQEADTEEAQAPVSCHIFVLGFIPLPFCLKRLGEVFQKESN